MGKGGRIEGRKERREEMHREERGTKIWREWGTSNSDDEMEM